MRDVLVIAAHPDDEVLGCGGTLLKRIKQGDRVHCVVLGEGLTSRRETRAETTREELEELHQCFKRVGKFMGFSMHQHCDLPDNRIDTVALLDVVKIVESVVAKMRPDVIYTHFENDLNVDHRLTFQAVITACRPSHKHTVKEIICFETPSSTEWMSSSSSPTFKPNMFVDVSDTLDKKIEAMALYESEVRNFPHPRSAQALRIRAEYWGLVAGCSYAEALQIVRKLD